MGRGGTRHGDRLLRIPAIVRIVDAIIRGEVSEDDGMKEAGIRSKMGLHGILNRRRKDLGLTNQKIEGGQQVALLESIKGEVMYTRKLMEDLPERVVAVLVSQSVREPHLMNEGKGRRGKGHGKR